jgi:glycosyltransferase 2 family protein
MSLPRRLARVGVGTGLLAGSWLALRDGVSPREERVFRAINDLPDTLRTPVRAVMQAGTFATVPIAAGVALLAGRRALAGRLLVGGTAAWLGAKALKPLGGRDRPAGVLGDVRIREGIEGDLGWVSGHAAVATTLALIAADELPAWTGPLATVAVTTGFGRIYVGAHLPHDVVGGVGLGSVLAGVLG